MAERMPLIDVTLTDGPVQAVAIEPFPSAAGAECVFLGRTRLETHEVHGPLTRLSYHAYEPMAHRLLVELAERAVTEFGCHVVRIHHAIGEVPPGAASVLIQVACGHRDAAFDACRSLIDELKRRVPIWKRERWADGATWSTGAPVEADS